MLLKEYPECAQIYKPRMMGFDTNNAVVCPFCRASPICPKLMETNIIVINRAC